MQSLIDLIVLSIPAGRAFDSHLVIEELVRQHTIEYAKFVAPQSDVASAHAQLSVMVGKSPNANRLMHDGKPVVFHSVNIRLNLSDNAAWLRN